MPVYEAIAPDIRDPGGTTVFGLMSDDTARLVATPDASGTRFCGARHENMAAAMAEGHAAAPRSMGMAILGRGPSTANLRPPYLSRPSGKGNSVASGRRDFPT
ncbi:MAG: hypothetical protein FJY55_06805 [Betaproteobacteria bacterium]|nr:hypothetical protein [Betaproteobacteria bacterium]